MNTQATTGIYCLGNDKVLDWLIAFFESLRTYEPDRRLIIIPFDNNIDKLSKLSGRYDFEFLQDNTLEELDAIGSTINPGKYSDSHMFRKFASFWGPLEHFLFLDSDIVVLGKLDELFDAYFISKCDFMHYDTSVNYVYKTGTFREQMIRKYSSKGFNSGCFLSSKGILNLDDVRKAAEEALSIKEHFAIGGEQPFFNYCIDTKRLKTATFFDFVPDLCKWTWANQKPIKLAEDAYRLMESQNPEFGKRLPFIHWSGILSSPFMPNQKIFLHYRLKGIPWSLRLKYIFYDWWQPGNRALISKLQRKKGMV